VTLDNQIPPETGPDPYVLLLPTPTQGSCVDTSAEGHPGFHCDLGGLAAGASARVSFTVAAPQAPGVITDRATVGSHEADFNTADNGAAEQTTVGVPTSMGINNIATPEPARVGDPLTYTVTVTNNQPGTATGVTITDALPPQVAFASADADQGGCANASGVVSCLLGTMAAGATTAARIVVTPTQTGDVADTATVSADGTPPSAAVAQSQVSGAGCGQVITQSMTLAGDVGPCYGPGLVVGADGITVDLGGHRVFGLNGASFGGHQRGIDLGHRRGVTVRNGTVSYFDAGVVIEAGGSNTVADLAVTDNLGNGPELGDGIVVFHSPGNHIVHNTVSRNGRFDGIGILGVGSDDNTVESNTIEDSGGGANPQFPYGQGIIVSNIIETPDSKIVRGNAIVGNTVRRNASAGIANANTIGGRVSDNVVTDNGHTSAAGNGIGVTFGSAPSATASDMVIERNQVHHNQLSGIIVNTPGNRVAYNDASDNAITPKDSGSGFSGNTAVSHDLNDTVGCRANSWVGNTWGTGGYDPACVTGAGGTGPLPPATPPPPRQAAPADFDHNGQSDIALYRPSTGQWFDKGDATRLTAPTATSYGSPGDIAVPADYDGDGHADRAVFRPSTGTWYVAKSSGGEMVVPYGASGDVPVPGDYDGDGKADLAVFRPSNGVWYIHPSGGGPNRAVAYGTKGDIAVPGDYNGDAKADIAVFRPAQGVWYVRGGTPTAWGKAGDVPVPGDYDANGSTDIAVYRPAQGVWYVRGGPTTAWGQAGDFPVPGDYDGNASTDMAVFRRSTGTWFAKTGLTTNWGTTGDQPLELPAAIRRAFFS